MRLIIFSTLSLLITLNAQAQGGFEKIIGGTSSDYVYGAIQTNDGGFLISGVTSSFGSGGLDVFLTKYDAMGTVTWTKTYGGTSNESRFSMVKELSDNNYILVAHTESFGSSGRDGYILKIDQLGNIIWNSRYSIASNETLRGVDELSNGDIVIAGACNSVIGATDAILLRLTSAGVPVYSKVYGGSGLDNFERVKLMPDGNLILAGNMSTWGPANQNGALIKTDLNGNIIWEKTYGGNGLDAIHDIEVLSDNSFVATLSGDSWGSGGTDGNLVKFDNVGSIEWIKSYGGSGTEEFKDLIVLPSGNILVYGYTTSFGSGGADLLLVKTNSNGNLIWAKTYGGTGTEVLEQGDLTFTLTNDFSVLIGGSSNSFGSGYQGVFIKTDTLGSAFCNNITSIISSTIPSPTTTNSSVSITTAGGYSSPTTLLTTPSITSTVPCLCNPGFGGADILTDSLNCFNMSFMSNYHGSAVSYLWDFGDGQTSTLQNPTHTYATPGSYNVCVTITNNCTTDTTICEMVTIQSNCICGSGSGFFNGTEMTTDLVDCLGISFGNTYTGDITDYWWDFGDGQYSDLSEPIHHYDTAGTYWVCLTITNTCGNDTTICDSIVVDIICESFNGTQISVILNGLVGSFDNSYDGNAIDWWWDFGDSQFSNLENPNHTYGAEGTYWVCLTLTNECDDDTTICDSISITISPKGINDFAASIGLNYYPNPVNTILNISLREDVDFKLFNPTGSLVRMERLMNGKHTLDLSDLSSGVYLIQFQNKNGSYHNKLIIQR